MTKHRILGLHITDRVRHAGGVQQLLTEYGCNIKTRIGLHDVDASHCSPNGLLLLELFGDDKVCDELAGKLAAIDGADVKEMVFTE
jgi:hypothetical protein